MGLGSTHGRQAPPLQRALLPRKQRKQSRQRLRPAHCGVRHRGCLPCCSLYGLRVRIGTGQCRSSTSSTQSIKLLFHCDRYVLLHVFVYTAKPGHGSAKSGDGGGCGDSDGAGGDCSAGGDATMTIIPGGGWLDQATTQATSALLPVMGNQAYFIHLEE